MPASNTPGQGGGGRSSRSTAKEALAREEQLLRELNRLAASVEQLAAQAQSRPVVPPPTTVSGDPVLVAQKTAQFGYGLLAEFMGRRRTDGSGEPIFRTNRVQALHGEENNKTTITFEGDRFGGTFAFFYTADKAEGAAIDASGKTVLDTIEPDQEIDFVVVYKAQNDEPVAVGTVTNNDVV
jgi:hypothetical protein